MCIYQYAQIYIYTFMHADACKHMHAYTHACMWPDFGKPTKLSQLVFWEIQILNIKATMFLLC